MSSNIRLTKKCHFCGKSFVAKTTVTKCCGDSCAKKYYKHKKKEEKIHVAELDAGANVFVAENNIFKKEFLSLKEASLLYGVSQRTLKRLLKLNKLPFLRFSRRIVFDKNQLEKSLKIEPH